MGMYTLDLANYSDKTVAAFRASLPAPVFYALSECASIHANELALTGAVRKVKDRAGNLCVARGVRIMKKTSGDVVNAVGNTTTTTTTDEPQVDTTGGDLVVHLYGDYNAAGENQYTRYDFVGGEKEGFLFDEIREDGTTITLEDVKILL